MIAAEREIQRAAAASWLALTAPGMLLTQAAAALALMVMPWVTTLVYVAPVVRAVAAGLLIAHCATTVLMLSSPRWWPFAVTYVVLLVLEAFLAGILVSGSAQPRGAAAPVVLLALAVSLCGGGWRTALTAALASAAGVTLGLWHHFTGPLLAGPAFSFPTILSIETAFAGVNPIVPAVVSFPGALSVETFLAGVPFQASTAPLFMPALTIVLAALVVGLGANMLWVRKAKADVIELIVAAGRLAA
ncbi:MAG TPA: hypothetical protein VN812_08585 [Candidatus Acidoferrales bacterium]|nr:hypothetical protein [Candidatus Acidoferrales bacterium]